MTYDLSDPHKAIQEHKTLIVPSINERSNFTPTDLADALADEIVRLRSDRAERDRKIAEAVRDACFGCAKDFPNAAALAITGVNLAAIIGSVK